MAWTDPGWEGRCDTVKTNAMRIEPQLDFYQRRIPIYVSHHVDMFYYVYAYVKLKLLADFGYTMYQFIMILPTAWLAQVNAAPTLTFLNEHLQWINQRCARKRIPSGVAHERFLVENQEQLVSRRWRRYRGLQASR